MPHLDFPYDVTLDEGRRHMAVLEAIGDDWDPVAVLAEEERTCFSRISTRSSSGSTTNW
jgi:hypothetical protein